MHSMRDNKLRFGVAIDKRFVKELEKEVRAGKDMKLNRSEVVEAILRIVFDNRKDKLQFSEFLRKVIMENRVGTL